MAFVLGMGCVLWTVYELFRLSAETPALVRTPTAAPERPVRAERRKRRRHPNLAAWDRSGETLVVEDVAPNTVG